MAIDPICGMEVDEATALSAERDGELYYFCCGQCKTKFLQGDAPQPHAPQPQGELVQLGAAPAMSSMSMSMSAMASSGEKPAAAYFCPMCPGVESDVPGICPKCGMALEPTQIALPSAPVYSCPMHPEVQSDTPGTCPKCGMALELQAAAADSDEDDSELRDMTRRFIVACVFGLPVLLLAMAPMLGLPLERWLSLGAQRWLQFVLSTPVVCWAGWPFFQRGWMSVRTGRLNMFTLIALGSGAAYGYSAVAILFPSIIPDAFRANGETSVYCEAAAMITALVLLGQVLELRARRRTGDALRELLAFAPQMARIVRDGKDVESPISSVQVGDTLRVRPGDKTPVDGVVIEGSGSLDQSMFTGEPIPVTKNVGDDVIGGSINQIGAFLMRAEHIGGDTMLSRVVSMVSQAQRSRAPIQQAADVASAYLTPIVIGVAIASFVVWAWFAPREPALGYALVNAVSVLIIACPCALGLATPMSIMVGVGRGAQLGVLLKNGEVIQQLSKIDTLTFDKTGTLTEGRPRLIECIVADPPSQSSEQLLQLAAAVEQNSEHPVAAAIVSAAHEQQLSLPTAEQFSSHTGKGVEAMVASSASNSQGGDGQSGDGQSGDGQSGDGQSGDGQSGDGQSGDGPQTRVLVGSQSFLEEAGITLPTALAEKADELRKQGHTVVFVGQEDTAVGLLSVADPVKETTPAALAEIRAMGLRVVMLTGDNEVTAAAVAAQFQIDEVHAGMTPQDKHDFVLKLRESGKIVAMAGDGVNDAPALAAADVGIAMDAGSDVAIEAAGVTLIGGDLRGIVKALRLGRSVMRNIHQNLFFAFVYNLVGVLIAAGVLYPLNENLLLNPMVAAAAMSLSSFSVVGNALRLKHASLE